MEEIPKVGFVMCGCGWHGHIAMRNDEMSDELFCKDMGYHAVRQLVQEGYLSEDEGVQTMYEVRHSPLPHALAPELFELLRTDAGLDVMLAKSPALTLDPWRTPRGHTQEESIAYIHEFLAAFSPQTRRYIQ